MNKIFIHSFIQYWLTLSGESVESVLKKKKKDTVGRIRRKERLKPGKHDP